MLKLNPDQLRQPIGGHHFTSHSITWKADSLPALVKKLSDFRITNGIPLGSPEQEILQYYGKEFPYMVMPVEEPVRPKISQYFDLWARWVGRTWKNPPKELLTPKEVDDRIDICRECPKNKEFNWKTTLETQALEQRTYLLRRGQPQRKECGFCSCHNADLSVFTMIPNPQPFSDRVPESPMPEKCWVKTGP